MRRINCYVSIRLCLSGSPDDDGELTRVVAETVGARLGFAREQMSRRFGLEAPACFHQPEITFPAGTASQVQSHLSGLIARGVAGAISGHSPASAQPRFVLADFRVPAVNQKPARAWDITYRKAFHIRLNDFAAFRASLHAGTGKSTNEELEAIYGDKLDSIVTATAWIVTARQPLLADDLADQLAEHLKALPESGSNFLSWAWTVNDANRLDLVDRAQGRELSGLPGMYANHGGRLQDGRVFLLVRGTMLFVHVSLPARELEDTAQLLAPLVARVQNRDLTSWINVRQFKEFFKIDWTEYVGEFGSEPAVLTIQPFVTQKAVSADALKYWLRDAALEIVSEDQAVFGHLCLLNAETVNSLPAAAQAALLGRYTRGSLEDTSSDRAEGIWDEGWFGAYIHSVVGPSQDELLTTRYRPEARRFANQVIDALGARAGVYHWEWRFLGMLVKEFHETTYGLRNSPPIAFEYFLKELEQREGGRWFNELFDAIEDAHYGDLYAFTLQMCEQTSYASHVRVQRHQQLFNQRRRSYLVNTYDAEKKEIVLDKNDALRMKPGDVLKGLKRVEKQIKPERLAALQTAVQRAAEARLGRLLRREDTSTYSHEDFAKAVLGDAAQAIQLSKDDLEEFTIQRYLRLLDVKAYTADGIERFDITYDYLDKVDDGPIAPVPNSRTTASDSDFEFLLWSWDFSKVAAFWETAIKVVSVAAILAIAWEVGAIAALVEAAGGGLAVGLSIGLSELIYICTAKHLSLEGFLTAALEGYLFALGFRFGGSVGTMLLERLGTQAIERPLLAWIAQKITVGAIGGGSSSFLITFSNDILDILAGRAQGLRSIGDYVKAIGIGAAMGIVFEFGSSAVQPILKQLGQSGLESVSTIIGKVRLEGIGLSTWAGLMDDALAKLNARLGEILDGVRAQGVKDAFASRIQELTGAMLESLKSDVFAQALRIKRLTITPRARRGIERLVEAIGGHIEDKELLELFDRLRSDPGQLRRLLEALETLDEASLQALADRTKLRALADSFAPKVDATPLPKPIVAHTEPPNKAVADTGESHAAASDPSATDAADTTTPVDHPTVDTKPTTPYKAIDDILKPDCSGFADPQLDRAYQDYYNAKVKSGETPAGPEEWAKRVTSGDPRKWLESVLGPDYARQGGTAKAIALGEIPRPAALSEARLQQALTKLRSRLTKVFERLGNLKAQGVVDGGVNAGHFNIGKGNVAEVLSEPAQDAILAEIRRLKPKAELITGVRVRVMERSPLSGAALSDAKLFTDNLIGAYSGDNLTVYGKVEVKAGARGGAEATTQVFEWVEGRLTEGSQILIPGRPPLTWHPANAGTPEVRGLASAKAYLITPQGAERYGLDSAMQTALEHGRIALPYTTAEIDYLTRLMIESIHPE